MIFFAYYYSMNVQYRISRSKYTGILSKNSEIAAYFYQFGC